MKVMNKGRMPYDTSENILLYIGHLYFICLVLAAGYFYQERMMNFDSAHYTFKIIQNYDFYVIHNRWVSYFTQWIPLVVLKLGLSYKTILIAYSVGLMGLNYLVYIILAHGVRNIYAATLLVAVFGAMLRHKFYAGISEIIPAISFGILFIGIFTRDHFITTKRDEIKELLLYLLCGVLIAMSHPVPILPVILVYGVWMIYHKKLGDWKIYAGLGVYILPMLVKFLSIQSGSYESNKLGFINQLIPVISNPKKYYVYELMWDYIWNEHWFTWLLFIFSLVFLIVQKRVFTFLALITSALVVLVLNLVTFHYLTYNCFIMIDGYMVFVGIVLCYFTCIELLKIHSLRKIMIPILVIFFTFNLIRIYHARHFFQQRINYMQGTIEKYESEENRILITKKGHTKWNTMWYPYQYSPESMLLSTLRGPDRTVLMVLNDENCKYSVNEVNKMSFKEKCKNIPRLKSFHPSNLKKTYFKLPEYSKAALIQQPTWINDEEIEAIDRWIEEKNKRKSEIKI